MLIIEAGRCMLGDSLNSLSTLGMKIFGLKCPKQRKFRKTISFPLPNVKLYLNVVSPIREK
jgi:hypothetical protein